MTIDKLYETITNLLNHYYSEDENIEFYSTTIIQPKSNDSHKEVLIHAIYMNYHCIHEDMIYAFPQYIFKTIINPQNVNKELGIDSIIKILKTDCTQYPNIDALRKYLEEIQVKDKTLAEAVKDLDSELPAILSKALSVPQNQQLIRKIN